MNAPPRLLPAPLLLAVLLLPACSSSRVVHAPVEVTIGQQRLRLETAQARGPLSDAEPDPQHRWLLDTVQRGAPTCR